MLFSRSDNVNHGGPVSFRHLPECCGFVAHWHLLSPTHPIGRYKALFFRTLGYEQSNWRQLESQVRSLLARPAEPLESTEYGTKYAITAPLTGLNGRMAEIVSIWIILAGEDMPRFVTAYPKD